MVNFYPRPPRGGRPPEPQDSGRASTISIHALREEGDVQHLRGSGSSYLFLSTPSARRATTRLLQPAKSGVYFYPRPPRGGRRLPTTGIRYMALISIHALREEGDSLCTISAIGIFNFYPRPPRGGRPYEDTGKIVAVLFLSTPSARRATQNGIDHARLALFLSTPSARRATRLPNALPDCLHISIHALREEGDLYGIESQRRRPISIHALREEGDRLLISASRSSNDFYPRPPRGGRQQKQRQKLYFQTNYTTFCTNLEEP